MRHPIPAPGYTLTRGRKPRLPDDAKLLVQIRGDGVTAGWVDSVPWPIGGQTNWKHTNHPGDIVAVKRVD